MAGRIFRPMGLHGKKEEEGRRSSMKTHQKILSSLHRRISASPLAVRAAVKIRNQANAVVAAHFSRLSGSSDIALNGEGRLAEILAPQAGMFIDVGGNRGDWTANFLRHARPCTQGWIYEANTACASGLRKSFKNNPAIRIREVALSDYSGEADFFESSANDQLSSLSAANAGEGSVRRTTPVTTLDHESASWGGGNVSFLKIDTEGHDYFVLRGARGLLRQQRIDVLQFECNATWRASGTNIFGPAGFLAQHGYRVMHLRPDGLFSVPFEEFGPDFGYGVWVAFHDGISGSLAPLIRS